MLSGHSNNTWHPLPPHVSFDDTVAVQWPPFETLKLRMKLREGRCSNVINVENGTRKRWDNFKKSMQEILQLSIKNIVKNYCCLMFARSFHLVSNWKSSLFLLVCLTAANFNEGQSPNAADGLFSDYHNMHHIAHNSFVWAFLVGLGFLL